MIPYLDSETEARVRRIKTINKWKKPCHTFFLLPLLPNCPSPVQQYAPKMCLIGERIQRLGVGGGAPRISNRGSGRLSDWRLAINCLGSDISISTSTSTLSPLVPPRKIHQYIRHRQIIFFIRISKFIHIKMRTIPRILFRPF